MSVQVVFLRSAEHDLKELRDYTVKHFSRNARHASYAKIKDAVNTIEAFPLGGNVPEELDRLDLTQYRQLVSGMNRIVYEVRQEIIYIQIVCDTRKDMKSLLTRRLLRIVSP